MKVGIYVKGYLNSITQMPCQCPPSRINDNYLAKWCRGRLTCTEQCVMWTCNNNIQMLNRIRKIVL